MRAWLPAALLLLPALTRAGVVAVPGARTVPVTGGQGITQVQMGGMNLNPNAKLLQGVLNLPGSSALKPDQLRAPIVNFTPNMDVPALPHSAVGQQEAGQYLETAAFETYTEPMKLQRMVPPGGVDVVGGLYAPMREQSQALSSKQAVISEEIEAAVKDSGSGADGALAFGDKVWDALLGRKNQSRTGSDWRPDSSGFKSVTGRASEWSATSSAESSPEAVPGLTLSPSPQAKPGTDLADQPGTEDVAELPSFMPLPPSAVMDPAGFAGRGGKTKTVRVLPIPRIMLTIYNGAMGLAYNTVPGHSFSTLVSYTAAAGLAGAGSARTQTKTPAFSKPAATSMPSFTGMTFTPASQSVPAAEAERFSYLQTAGQVFPTFAYTSVPSVSFASSGAASKAPVNGLPLWAFPASAFLPLLALGLLVRQD